MKRIYTILLSLIAGILMTACSDDLFNSLNVPEGKPVTLSISYKELAPKVISISRATDDKKLQNLQIFVFSATSGKLKGYKFLDTNDPELTPDNGEVTIKTTSGLSYIYAVANVGTGTYPVGTSPNGLTLPDSKDDAFDEEDVQAGGKQNITRNDFMKLPFNRHKKALDITEGVLMSGSLNNGNPCTINQDGTITSGVDNTDNTIHLRRVVAKVTFNLKVKEGDGVTRTFTPTSYDVVNVPQIGNLMEGAVILDGQEADDNFEELNDSKGEWTDDVTRKTFIAYLPENLQTAQKEITVGDSTIWHQREADNQKPDPNKAFTNAPAHGTYLRIHGRYSEEAHGTQGERVAYTTYYVHLGDFSKDNGYNNNDYNVHRNYAYKYTVTVAGVNKIIVEAETEKDEQQQPGAEGLVFELKGTKPFELDAHYEYCVMTFDQEDIKELVNNTNQGGYAYSVQEFGKSTGPIIVQASGAVDADNKPIDDKAAEYNGIHLNWIRFCEGGTANEANIGRGVPANYPGVDSDKLLSLNQLLRTLANDANDDSKWQNGKRTFTCFLDENYYPDLKWNVFTNGNPRRFFIANDIKTSQDGRSTYAQVQYSVSQEEMQTFYNTENSDLVDNKVVFGIEAISNEQEYEDHYGIQPDINKFDRNNGDNDVASMKGREGTIKDQDGTFPQWQPRYDKIYEACLSRNRDLNGNGTLEANEIKWYTPTVAQYTGMWLGAQALKKKLYEGNLGQITDLSNGKRVGSRHYYTSTQGHRIYWAEEAMAFGNVDYPQNNRATPDLKYLRCIRNIKSEDKNNTAYKEDPISYLQSRTSTDGHVLADLSYLDKSALKEGEASKNELLPHNEQETPNKPFPTFEIANKIEGSGNILGLLNGSWNCKNFNEQGLGWRVPNQRELCVMFLLGRTTPGDATMTRSSDPKPYNQAVRLFWRVTGNELIMKHYGSYFDKVNLRCIREK